MCTRTATDSPSRNLQSLIRSSLSQYGTEDWDDDLDYACLVHDKCLCAGETDAELLDCDRALRSAADRIADENDNCKGWANLNPFCWNDKIVCSAQNVALSMAGKIDFGLFLSSPTCDCVKHRDKPSCPASSGDYDYEDSSSGDYDYEDSSSGDYDYEDSGSDDYDYEDSSSGDYDDEDSLSSDENTTNDSEPVTFEVVVDELPSDGTGDSEDGQSLEKFNLEMDWNPSSCVGDDQCESTKITNAFTVSEMAAKLVDRSQDNNRCWDESSDQAKKLVVSDEVSKGTKAALECMFENAAGSNEDLWRDVYVRVGSCSGMSPSQYFDTVTRLFMSVGANQIAADFGLLSHDGTDGETEISVDRDSFLDYVTERVGRKAWVECDPDTRILRNVLVCVNPNDPYLIQDCTMDRNDPTSTNGIPCRGELLLPINPSGEISDKCSPYLLSEPNPALDGANTRITDPSPPGSSSQRWGRAGLLLATAFVLHI